MPAILLETDEADDYVTLTRTQVARIKLHIINKRHRLQACFFAGLTARSLTKILQGGPVRHYQRDLLLAFCDTVERQTEKRQKEAAQ